MFIEVDKDVLDAAFEATMAEFENEPPAIRGAARLGAIAMRRHIERDQQ